MANNILHRQSNDAHWDFGVNPLPIAKVSKIDHPLGERTLARMASVGPTSSDLSAFSRSLREMEDEAREDRRRSNARQEETLSELEDKTRRAYYRETEELKDALEKARDAQTEGRKEFNEAIRDENAKMRRQTYDRYGRDRDEQLKAMKTEYAEQLKEMEKQFAQRAKSTEEERDRSNRRIAETYEAKASQQSFDERRSREAEAQELRDRMRDLIHAEKYAQKAGAQARSEAIREVEQPYEDMIDHLRHDYDAQLRDAHYDFELLQREQGRVLSEKMRDKDERIAKLIADQNSGHRKEILDLRKDFEGQVDRLKKAQESELARREKGFEDATDSYQRNLDEQLARQAGRFQETLRNNKEAHDTELRTTQKALQTQRTTSEIRDLPPAAAEEFRKRIVAEETAKQNANDRRHEEEVHALKQQFGERQSKSQFNADTRMTQLQEESQKSRSDDRAAAMKQIQELMDQRSELVFQSGDDTRNALDRQYRDNNMALERQRTRYEEAMDLHSEDQGLRLKQMREAGEQREQALSREFQIKHRETVKEYEKKLESQKELYEGTISDLKFESERMAREVERRSRLKEEENNKLHEQRVQQMELQQKERERVLTENFESEVDKLRRSNQYLQKKAQRDARS